MKKNLKEIIDACIGLGAAGMLLGVTGYYCLPTVGKITPTNKNEPPSLNERYKISLKETPYSQLHPTRDTRFREDIIMPRITRKEK